MLEGFKTFDFSEGVASVSVTNNGVTFNKAVTMKLNYPEWVLLLINEETRQIAIQPCSESTPNSAPFYKDKGNGIFSVRWNSRDLLNNLESMMSWDLGKDSYRITGKLLREENAVLFDLNNASNLNPNSSSC